VSGKAPISRDILAVCRANRPAQGAQGFIANGPALENPETEARENYANLKAQCSYVLADRVNKHRMAVRLESFQSEAPGIGEEV
jgi:hypothetical protein